ncbi:hypothetical protein FISHEDRAFT_45033 [Fistulina hepatica ATCC 64428]|uniref:Uncharacterized protein n=1 Tax=Fistulina hepatica ATCC 64428 TaxID=1128425 RepID=A0A0D7A963_9AGAR|nr:hypothetical protein FISHEDRAFT_45033 [Fistulina hepatica ATCC 64428]
MKYPIANVNYVIDTYGEDVGQGYDIMCAFMKTLHRSSIAEKVKNSRLVGVVPAFHGHAHSRDCQVDWHPRYVKGVGMEDFEGSEHFFSRSNELAATTRTCTPFHRRQQILEFLDFHNMDQYANHGRFLFTKYCAALRRIEDNVPQLAMLEERLHTTADDYERYLQEERTYLHGLKKEPPDVAQRFEYMEALDRFRKAELESSAACTDYEKFNRAYEANEMFVGNAGKIKSRYTRTARRVAILDEEVARLEDTLGIHDRWEPDTPEYINCRKELYERQYRCALDELERLVVQRLLELTKLNMSGVGKCLMMYG